MVRILSPGALLGSAVAAIILGSLSCQEAPASTVHARNSELVEQHTKIWKLMGLSERPTEELNRIVVAINTQVEKNKHEHPEAFAEVTEVKRSVEPPTYDEYIAKHKQRFGMLKISEPTRKELLAAAELTWNALHDPDVDPEKREVAETIREMMTSMGGPPPCCDDNLFGRVGTETVLPEPPPEIAARLKDLSVGELELKEAFNRDVGAVRLLLILSPT